MNSANNRFASHVLWELKMIRYTTAPVVVTDETRAFIEQLTDSRNSDGQTLTDFLLALPLYSVRDGVIELLLSSNARALIAEHDDFAAQKETAVADSQFALAGQKRDAQREVLEQLHRLIPDPLAVYPEHIIELFRTLGFDGSLPSRQ